MMAILPECQGKGLGRKLVDALIGEARDRRVNVALAGAPGTPCSIARMRSGPIELTVTTVYSSGAVGFYKKLGFQEVTPPRMLADGTITGVSNLRKRQSSAYVPCAEQYSCPCRFTYRRIKCFSSFSLERDNMSET